MACVPFFHVYKEIYVTIQLIYQQKNGIDQIIIVK